MASVIPNAGLEGSNHFLDRQVKYSTVNLDLEELKIETLPEWQHFLINTAKRSPLNLIREILCTQ